MNPVTTSAEFLMAMAIQLVLVVSAFVWVKSDTTQNGRDLKTIKRALGLENGDDPAFVRMSSCVLMEKEVDRRLAEVQREVQSAAAKADNAVAVAQAESGGIQHRLTAVELTLKVLANK